MSVNASITTVKTEKELRDIVERLNDRLYAWDDKMTEMVEEIIDIFDVYSEAVKPIVQAYYSSQSMIRDDKDVPGCGNCIHLWDEDACLGTVDGSACLKWEHNNSIKVDEKE